ncbi:hypothetical protein CALCODRAFT_35419 [Calocera cornea HHB12733]|uniref:Uncharacterized protein n=1 Tax=Calocera cornea HHB12733 TaxID=1353952 RepID=A0A165E0M7_9BASI|nr:hypothetical protein CALCODRAFT_35419 [Calocera cornea HHB12733]
MHIPARESRGISGACGCEIAERERAFRWACGRGLLARWRRSLLDSAPLRSRSPVGSSSGWAAWLGRDWRSAGGGRRGLAVPVMEGGRSSGEGRNTVGGSAGEV